VTDRSMHCGLRTWTRCSMIIRCCVSLTANESSSHRTYTCCLRSKIWLSHHRPPSAGTYLFTFICQPYAMVTCKIKLFQNYFSLRQRPS